MYMCLELNIICNFVFLKQCVEDSSLLQRVAELQEQMLQQQQKLDEQQQKLDEQQHKLVELQQQRKVVQELQQRLQWKFPSLGNTSPSEFAKNASLVNAKVNQSAPLYTHWFAMEMYGQIYKLRKQTTPDSMTVSLNGQHFDVSSASLTDVIERFNAISRISEYTGGSTGYGVLSDSNLREAEATFTACYARALDRFLFSDKEEKTGACFHQLPAQKKSSGVEKVDLYVAKLHQACLPSTPIVLCDVKRISGELQLADNETCGYAIRAMEIRNTAANEWPVYIGLVFTCKEARLLLVAGADGYVQRICIDSIKIGQESEMKPFFCVLYGAVHYLLEDPIFEGEPVKVPVLTSLRDIDFWSALDISKEKRDFRVFPSFDKKTVYKFYDTEHTHAKPNLEVIRSISSDYLSGLCLRALTEDERVLCLQYDYVEGEHTTTKMRHFIVLLRALHRLHQSGYVHGDIRKANLVFDPKNDDRAWMIDFDLAGVDSTNYPPTYNSMHIMERHKDARANRPMRKVHDRHALYQVMVANHMAIPDHVADALTKNPPTEDLNTIADNLEESMNNLI